MKKMTLPVRGMHCASCSARIEKVVGALDGVEECTVNLAAETMSVEFDETRLSLEALAQQVKELGFELVLSRDLRQEVVLDIKGMSCASCSSRIEKVVGGLPGVSACSVNLATEKAKVTFAADQVRVRDLIQTIKELGFTATVSQVEGRSTFAEKQRENRQRLRAMVRRLWPALFLALLVMVFSMSEMVGISLPAAVAPGQHPFRYALIQFLLVVPVLWLGRNFYLIGIPALLRRVPNMDSLIALGTGAAFIYSTWNLIEIGMGIEPFHKAHDLYFESAAMLIALVSLGKYLEARSKLKTSDAISKLMALTPDTATLLKDGEQVKILAAEIVKGDHILVRPGDRVAVDGVVENGESAVDESMLTGESIALKKGPGDRLYGGTLNKNGALTVVADKVGEETMVARIIRLVEDAQGSKAPIANLADRISLYFVPTVMAIALVAGLSWYFLGQADFTFALRIFIAVLVIACPCAMGLATPTSIMVGTGRGAQLGVLVKNGGALEMAQKVQTIIFDKTGTLTHGRPSLTDFLLFSSQYDGDALLALLASAESSSEHPLAEALVNYVRQKEIPFSPPLAFQAVPGRGIEAQVSCGQESCALLLGNVTLMQERKVGGLSLETAAQAEELSAAGKTALYLSINGELQALVGVADHIKNETPATIRKLRAMGLEVVMLTGDNEKTARAIAAEAGIDRVIAGVLPDHKAQEVKRLQEEGRVVAMVGDGINDAPALATADLGIAMGTGIDVAIESGDVVLMKGNLDGVVTALALSRATMTNIKQNLFWAFAYNIIGIPVAAGVLYIFGGPTLNPMIAGAAMALSSVSVVTNALRLRFYRSPQV
ncbi:MAG: heavy metal translocating P-type ATPase [Desulfurivibrionaceae bacterium]|nr:heavy metal translocating P-type ATPase [Desulfurivibrionaceae bacterium]